MADQPERLGAAYRPMTSMSYDPAAGSQPTQASSSRMGTAATATPETPGAAASDVA